MESHSIMTEALIRILRILREEGFLIIGNNGEIAIEEFPMKPCREYRCIFEKWGKSPKA